MVVKTKWAKMCIVHDSASGWEAWLVGAKMIGKKMKADVYWPKDVKKAMKNIESKRKTKIK